ncbi:hypothetical protein ERO13_D12G034300v2 [Gossypium hirsutum]|nr:hypothetical protein ERO13_D12G034300v2 [Gossypium hirsutum]
MAFPNLFLYINPITAFFSCHLQFQSFSYQSKFSSLKQQPTTMAMAFKMATTGMWVTDECKNSFMEMKWKKVHRYIVFKIDEKSRLVTVDKVGGPGESYDDLTASLPIDDCRYAVFDFDFVTVDNCRKSKLFFIACIKNKGKNAVRNIQRRAEEGARWN